MICCPYCYCFDWDSIEKNKDGVNLKVRCAGCGWTYRTLFTSEPVEYRLADGFSHGRLMVELKAAS
jgi:hypothetical protein